MAGSPPSTFTQWTTRRVVAGTLAVLAVVLAFWLLYRFRLVVFTFFAAIVISTAIKPAADWLGRRGLSRLLSVLLVYLVLLALLAGFIFLLVPMILEQAVNIVPTLSDFYQDLRSLLVNARSRLVWRIGVQLPSQLSVEAPTGEAEEDTLGAVTQILNYAALAAQGVFTLVAVFLLSFYWTKDGDRTVRSLLALVPGRRRETLRELISAIEGKVGAFVRGQIILMISVGLMAMIAYLIIGLPNALLLALIAGVLEVVPILGPILGAVPAGLIAISMAPSKLLWVALATLIIQQLEGNLLVPRVMDRSVGVNNLVTFLALAAFTSLFGVAGAVLAIPLAAVIQLLLDRFVLGPTAVEQETVTGRDYISKLRYEAQALIKDVRKQVRNKQEDPLEDTDHVEDEIESIASDLDSVLARTAQEEAAR
jgi:predicted PurR-regulated permease PerM